MEIDQSMTFEQAEEYVKGLDSFEPYVDPLQEAIDQLLPTLDDDQAETVINFFHEWETDKAYVIGDRVRYQNVLYRCIQAHTSQDDWTPDVSASLWVRTSPASEDDDPTTVPEWVQPAGAQDAYNTGDRVIFNGVVYESTVDGNVWSPADYPAGWVVVE
jgi:chitodextrinase